jgi:hypothetical protein
MRVIPSLSPRRWLSPDNNRVALDIALFGGLNGVHSRCGLPDRRAACLARFLRVGPSQGGSDCSGQGRKLTGCGVSPLVTTGGETAEAGFALRARRAPRTQDFNRCRLTETDRPGLHQS